MDLPSMSQLESMLQPTMLTVIGAMKKTLCKLVNGVAEAQGHYEAYFQIFDAFHQLYYCGPFEAASGNLFLKFTLPLFPNCEGHVSLFSSPWDQHKVMHLTLEKIDEHMTRQLQSTSPSSSPVYRSVCSTYYVITGNRNSGYFAQRVPPPPGRAKPDCNSVPARTAAESFANPSLCLQRLCSGFIAFLNRAFVQQAFHHQQYHLVGISKRRRKFKEPGSMRYGGVAKRKPTVTFEDISRSLDGFCYDYTSVFRKKKGLDAFDGDAGNLRFNLASTFAVQPSHSPDILQLVYRNMDELHAVAIIRKGSWTDRGAITVCTRFPEDTEDNWTWDTFTFFWNKHDGWKGMSESTDVLSDLSQETQNALQNYLNQLLDKID